MRARLRAPRSRSHAFAAMHVEGTTVQPWSLPAQPCVFRAMPLDRRHDRVLVALPDTAEPPGLEDHPRAPAPDARERPRRLTAASSP